MKNNILRLNKLQCVGCRSCEQVCPQKCISLLPNYEGFLYPEINGSECIECGLCIKHCPELSVIIPNTYKKIYGAVLNDSVLLSKSSSGGIFAGIAKYIIKNNGIVYGSAYDESLMPNHIEVNSLENLPKLQGSKYVTSDTKDTYTQVKEKLHSGKTVLYSGTPCQIAGLNAFLNKEYDNLYTIDLICHGTPSQKLFEKYLHWLSKKIGGKIIYYGFRDKEVAGWGCGFNTSTKTRTKKAICDPYFATFLRCETFRESCYQCRYSNMNRISDITIGDFWGVEKYYPDFEYRNGCSCVIVNTKKGMDLFDVIAKQSFTFFECKEFEIREFNTNLNNPSLRPKVRDEIYKGINEQSPEAFFKHFKYSNELYIKLCGIVSKIFPKKIKRSIKSLLSKR